MFYKIIHFLQLPGVDTALNLGKNQTLPCIVMSSAVLPVPRGLKMASTTHTLVLERVPFNVPSDDNHEPITPLQGHCPDGSSRTSAEETRQHPELQVASVWG